MLWAPLTWRSHDSQTLVSKLLASFAGRLGGGPHAEQQLVAGLGEKVVSAPATELTVSNGMCADGRGPQVCMSHTHACMYHMYVCLTHAPAYPTGMSVSHTRLHISHVCISHVCIHHMYVSHACIYHMYVSHTRLHVTCMCLTHTPAYIHAHGHLCAHQSLPPSPVLIFRLSRACDHCRPRQLHWGPGSPHTVSDQVGTHSAALTARSLVRLLLVALLEPS